MSENNQKELLSKRYKHKLNMLGPGQVMLFISLALLGLGIVFSIIGIMLIYRICFWSSGGVFLTLLVLVKIELHQDKVLYELAKEQDPDIE